MRPRSVAVVITTLFIFNLLAFGQSATTSLRGTITDPKGAVVQGGTVVLSNAATGYSRTAKSGSDGVYQFLEVPPATYTLTVTVAGFATVKQDHVTLQVSQPATLDIPMASTSRRCPSTYRGSEVRSRRLFPSLGGTVIVKTLAMNANPLKVQSV